IAPAGNINYATGHAVFEATHGTAPKYANQDVVNPGSVILSGVMMLEYVGWQEAAAAASCQPMYSSIMTPLRITLPGLTTSWLAYFGAVPWVASKTAWPVA